MTELTAQLRGAAPGAAGRVEANTSRSLLAAWDTLGWIRFREGRLAEAEAYVSAAERMWPSAEVSAHLAEILGEEGYVEEATRAWARAVVLSPSWEAARRHLSARVPASEVDAHLQRARAEITTRGAIPATLDGATPAAAVLLVLGADGKIAAVRPSRGAGVPGGAERLVGATHGIAFPPGAPGLLAVQASYACSERGCAAVLAGDLPLEASAKR